MRDIVLLAILPFLIFAISQRPFVGLGLWIWTALFFPNGWVYGLAKSLRYNLIFAGLTICVYLFSKQKSKINLGLSGALVILFLIWTALSTMLGIGNAELQLIELIKFTKIIALFYFILLIIDKKLHIDFFLWCIVFSVGFFAGLEALKYIASGGGHRIEGLPGHILQDNNQLALAFAMLLPICFYLLNEYGKIFRFVKFGLLGLIALIVIAIIGTNSRGGLLSLLAVGGYLFIKSKRKLLFVLLAILVGSVVIGIIPQQWFDRMNTISTADSDNSFMTRVGAWKLSVVLALQNPFFGGGFKALEYPANWFLLSSDLYRYPFLQFGTAIPDTLRSHAAHSIYFQVLGDHGFVGLFIFVSLLLHNFFKAGGIANKARKLNAPDWIRNLATMLKLSIFVYCVGGSALSFAYFDLIYAIFALLIVLEAKFLVTFQKREKI